MPPSSKRDGLSLKTLKTDNCIARNKSMQRRQSHRRPPTKRITLLPQPPCAPRSLRPPPSSLTSDKQDSATASLHATLILLQQLYVRHKNQHRSQAWFKSLSLLRRSLRKLYDVKLDLLSLQQPVATEASKSTTTSADQVRRSFDRECDLRSQAEGIQVGIRETVLPKCYVAFSTVVADAQFAPLGVVLIGVMGDVSKVVGMPTPGYGLQEEKRAVRSGSGLGGGEVAGRIRRETGRRSAAEMDVRFELGGSEGGAEDVDLGEIVVRDDVVVEGVGDVADDRSVERNEGSDVDAGMAKREGSRFTQRPLATSLPTPARSKRQGQAGKSSQKKSKKKSAIDDIFADFG